MRSKILKVFEAPNPANLELFGVFDEALQEVERMLQDGTWTDFMLSRSMQEKKSSSTLRSTVVTNANL